MSQDTPQRPGQRDPLRDDTEALRALLRRIDGASYGAYRDLRGRWTLGSWALRVDRVQGDPFAAPSAVALEVPEPGLPATTLKTRGRRVATADFLLRRVHDHLRRGGASRRGSGRSGAITALVPGQEVLERSAVQVHPSGALEVRVRVGLPARGRRVLGRQAAALLLEDLPALIDGALRAAALDLDALERHLQAVEDQQALRDQLAARGLVGFVADGARLPRRSGVDPRPMAGDVVATDAPASLALTLQAPHAGPVRGLGVPEGLTLIVGGGYHGKSTLLHALQRGVYDHIPGDGRERVVARADAVSVRAEDGRAVGDLDIHTFIGALPSGADTRRFTTADASGSTSQAAAIVEALEAGSRALLLDEDTSATNLLVRDARMAALVAAEPITPLRARAAALREAGVSIVLVVGASGAWFGLADTVIWLDHWQLRDATARARALAEPPPELPTSPELPGALPERRPWRVAPGRISLRDRKGRQRVRADDVRRLQVGEQEVDLRAVAQLVCPGQVRAAGLALDDLRDGFEQPAARVPDVAAALDDLDDLLDAEGLDALSREPRGDLSRPRRFEVAALLARLRG